jgi:hypothetical protein
LLSKLTPNEAMSVMPNFCKQQRDGSDERNHMKYLREDIEMACRTLIMCTALHQAGLKCAKQLQLFEAACVQLHAGCSCMQVGCAHRQLVVAEQQHMSVVTCNNNI